MQKICSCLERWYSRWSSCAVLVHANPWMKTRVNLVVRNGMRGRETARNRSTCTPRAMGGTSSRARAHARTFATFFPRDFTLRGHFTRFHHFRSCSGKPWTCSRAYSRFSDESCQCACILSFTLALPSVHSAPRKYLNDYHRTADFYENSYLYENEESRNLDRGGSFHPLNITTGLVLWVFYIFSLLCTSYTWFLDNHTLNEHTHTRHTDE